MQDLRTYLESHTALAIPDGQGGLTIRVNTQGVFYSQGLISKVLKLPFSKVRVIGSAVGGGFGGKKSRVEMYAALLALQAGKPVRMQFTRDEEFIASLPRHPAVIEIRSGVKRDGRLTAREAKLYYDTGAYTGHGPMIVACGAIYAKGVYRIPHVRTVGYTVYTNKAISGAFRGYGNPQSTFAVESHMDAVARELGIDPLDLRRINGMEHGDSLANGQKMPGVWLKKTLEDAARCVSWEADIPGGDGGHSVRRGRGIACGMNVSGGLSSSAIVKMMEDGTIQVVSGVIEVGAGQLTMAAQVAAEELGIGIEDVRVVSADTDATPFENHTAASRVTYNVGNVVRLAAADAKRQLLDRASDLLEVPVGDLRVEDKQVLMPGAPGKGMTFGEIVKAAHVKRGGPIMGRGVFDAVAPPLSRTVRMGVPAGARRR
ncbi:MAG: molybdopterin-dependent oxidoreductase [Nitrospinota bacterium]|nr:molybdopterin-dependent oxidoreductase [Nitrospinota bacterium]